MNLSWPDDRKFAFTVFDDTDWATVEKLKPVYDLLFNLGMRTTKSVWVIRGNGTPINEGMTCEDQEYLDWIDSLRNQGFEVGLHNVAPATSSRNLIQGAIKRFHELFGEQPIVHCNHVGCLDGIYWGDARLSGFRRVLYNILTRNRRHNISRGHVAGDPLFWGDLCQKNVRYVRNFVFQELNSLSLCPGMPYHDPAKPFVNFWFASADGGNLRAFLKNFTYENIDRLENDGGACIGYVHFAGRFVQNGTVDPRIRERLEYIASKDGWFATVSEILDHLRGGKAPVERSISPEKLHRLETKWLIAKVVHSKG